MAQSRPHANIPKVLNDFEALKALCKRILSIVKKNGTLILGRQKAF
jgi:hypothetical protein